MVCVDSVSIFVCTNVFVLSLRGSTILLAFALVPLVFSLLIE